MSLLAALVLKVSAILLVALIGAACLRTRSASARHWVLAIGVALAAVAPVLHVLPILPVVEVVPADAGVLGPAVASEAVVAAASDDVVGRLAVTIWLVGAVASVGVLLVGLARLRWLRASSSRVTDGPWHRLCSDLARSCGLKRRSGPERGDPSGAGQVGVAASRRVPPSRAHDVGPDPDGAAQYAARTAPRVWRDDTSGRAPRRPCTAPGFLDSGLTVFASTRPRPARRGRVAPGRGFDSRISPASTARCMSV